MPTNCDVQKFPKQQRDNFRRQYAWAGLFLLFLMLFILFVILNCLFISIGCVYATFVFLGLTPVFFGLYVYEKSAQWSIEAKLEAQGQIRKPRGFVEHFWQFCLPGAWERPIAVDKPRAEIEMSGLPDLERPLPVSTRAEARFYTR